MPCRAQPFDATCTPTGRFTLSGGVSCNKTVSKIASALHKPNQQTVLQPSEGAALVLAQPVHKVPLLRGKLGRSVRDFVLRLRPPRPAADATMVTMAEVSLHLEDSAAAAAFSAGTLQWLQSLCRGEDHSGITPRMRPKSLLACKSFGQPGVTAVAELQRWLLLLAAEVVDRTVEDTAIFNRRPKTLVVYHSGLRRKGAAAGSRAATPSCTRSTRMPSAKILTAEMVADAALATILKIEAALPCSRAAIAATDFADVVPERESIARFLTKTTSPPIDTDPPPHPAHPTTSAATSSGRKGGRPPKRPLEAMFAKIARKRPADEARTADTAAAAAAAAAVHQHAPVSMDMADVAWPCPFCTFVNVAHTFSCSMCDNMKGAAPPDINPPTP